MTDSANPLLNIWAEGRKALNGWLAIPSILSTETMARTGWDSLTIDLQHGTADYADMLRMLPVLQSTGVAPIVRVPWNDPAQIMRALDAGALGIICPMIETVEDAERFVSSCYYPPKGARSFGPIRARLAYGDEYAKTANDLVLPIAMIETKSAFENLDRIAAVEGIAALYIGPADLSSALGFGPGFDRKEPELAEAFARVRKAAHANGIRACMHCMTPEYAAEMAATGFDLVTIGGDTRFMEAGAHAVTESFRELSR